MLMLVIILNKKTYHPCIDEYMLMVENGDIVSCDDQKKLMEFLRWKLDAPGVVIDGDIIDKSIRVAEKYFSYKFYPWEKFINAFLYGVRYKNGHLMFDRYLIYLGRGAGKNGFASPNCFFMLTGHHGIKGYDIDLVATSEDQAKRCFIDVYEVLEDPENKNSLSKVFYKSKQLIKHRGTNSTMVFNTSNARTKDSKRTGMVIFDEIHEYQDHSNITVFTSGLGKRKDPRTIYLTTDGKVRGGVLDSLKNNAQMVLSKQLPDSTLFPFMCRIDKQEDAENPEMWHKANPSLMYNPTLLREMEIEYHDMQTDGALYMEFYRKRMNFPLDDILSGIAPWETLVSATEQPMPELDYRPNAIGSIDYASKKDFCAVGILFKYKGKRYFIHHTFVFRESVKQQGINQEVLDKAEAAGFITYVTGDEISTDLLIEWFAGKLQMFNIQLIVADRYRSSILETKFTEAGFRFDVVCKGPATHAKLAPLVDEIFATQNICFPGDALMPWYINNVYKHLHANGNTEYRKIEEKSRKTDGFFALLHALVHDDDITEARPFSFGSFKALEY